MKDAHIRQSVFPMFLVMPSFSKASNAAADNLNPVSHLSLVIQKVKKKGRQRVLNSNWKGIILGNIIYSVQVDK